MVPAALPSPAPPPMLWDVFCRVVDNHGDLGVCWRLAADLAERGEQVRLWVDDLSALTWMAPHGAARVSVRRWADAELGTGTGRDAPGDVVIETFGCELPRAFVERMSRAPRHPVWINLEHLSAEDYVERVHRLASPQLSGAAAGLMKWFFYPGFTAATGGLIRERGLIEGQAGFDADAWLAQHGVAAAAGERIVSLFCYEQPGLAAMLQQLALEPTLLLATPGHAGRQVRQLLGETLRLGALRAVQLPALSQADYDRLLRASDLNFVRGEDSFVRAQWAAKPFVWQIYRQADDVHLDKLRAFLRRFGAGADPALAARIAGVWNTWNLPLSPTQAQPPAAALPDLADWQRACTAWRDSLLGQADLTAQLLGFARESR